MTAIPVVIRVRGSIRYRLYFDVGCSTEEVTTHIRRKLGFYTGGLVIVKDDVWVCVTNERLEAGHMYEYNGFNETMAFITGLLWLPSCIGGWAPPFVNQLPSIKDTKLPTDITTTTITHTATVHQRHASLDTQ